MSAGWEVRRLGDVSKVNYGYTEKASFEKIGPRFLRITDIQNNQVNWETVPFCKIEENNLPKYLLGKGDIVFARTGATTGKSFLINDPPKAVFASYLIRLQILNQEELLPEFLYSFFQTKTYWDRIEAGTSGSAQGGFNASKLSGMEIPVPPIEEQRRIVAVLDEALAGVQQATANTERNLANTQELLDAHLQAIFANPAADWEEKPLKEIASEMITGPFGSALHKSDYVEDGIPVINPQNIVDGKIIPLAKTMISPETKRRLRKDALREKDLVIARRGEMGRCAIVTKDQDGWLCGTGSLVIRFKECADEQYLNLFLSSPIAKSILEENSSGTTMNNLSQGVLKQMQVPMPPLDEQRRIVAQLDDLAAETQRLQAIYRQKLAALQELKQSILQQAFSGQLTQSATHLRGASHLPPTPNTQSATHL